MLPIPTDVEKIRYRTMTPQLYLDEIPLDSWKPFMRKWGQHHNTQRAKVINKQYKIDCYPEE